MFCDLERIAVLERLESAAAKVSAARHETARLDVRLSLSDAHTLILDALAALVAGGTVSR